MYSESSERRSARYAACEGRRLREDIWSRGISWLDRSGDGGLEDAGGCDGSLKEMEGKAM
jgi:hypothetical protein